MRPHPSKPNLIIKNALVERYRRERLARPVRPDSYIKKSFGESSKTRGKSTLTPRRTSCETVV